MQYQTKPTNCKDSWYELSNNRQFCKVHGKTFKNQEGCPLSTKKEIYISEQAKKQASESLNSALDYTGIDNSAPNWVSEVNNVTQDIRSHAFTFKVSVKNPKNWSMRQKLLELAGFKVIPNGGVTRTDRIFFKGFKIWLSRNKITVYFPDWKQYWVDMARSGYNYAIADLIVLLNDLEKVLGSDFRIKREYHFKVSRQHHALVQNSLAKQYNREHKKLEVFNERGELWLLIDNSDPHNIRMNDLETVNTKESPKDMDSIVKPFFEQLHRTELMPNDILNMFKDVANLQKDVVAQQANLIEDRKFWAENQKTHVGAIQILSDSVSKLDKRIEKLSTLQSKPQSKHDKARKILRKYGW